MRSAKWNKVSGTRVFMPVSDFVPTEPERTEATRHADHIEIKVGDLHTFTRKTKVNYKTYAVVAYNHGEYMDFCVFLSKGEASIPSGKYALTPAYIEKGEIR